MLTLLITGGWFSVVIILIVLIIGCAISMFGGGSNSKSYTPVSAEVKDYRPIIQKYAKEHGIPEYTDLIMAVMMQESCGKGLEPMQASECPFNTRFLHHPGSIVDPEYSINVGIQNLAACLKAANVQSPIDMDNIKLALQGYNYGNGYMAWAREHYEGYSTASALEFSDLMAKKKGWSSYGDSNYVLNVLRYYPIGRCNHVGIVEKCEDGVVYTIEGNSGDACKRQHYPVGSKKIFGYGCPMY